MERCMRLSSGRCVLCTVHRAPYSYCACASLQGGYALDDTR
jgi:hypothetical protein